jgi:hypothetical protein
MKKMNYYFVGFLFLLLLSSCNGGITENKQSAVQSADSTTDIRDIKNVLKNTYYLFPSPVEVMVAVNQGGLVFEPKLMNSLEKREKYVKPNDQYLNIGVYLADLSYCAIFGRNSDAENYLETIKRLSDDVSLSSEINNDLMEKVKNNENSVDSLIKISNEFFFKIVNDLEQNNRQNDVAVISTGAYIECLYLSVNLVKKYSANNLIILKIAEQKHAFGNLFKYSQKHISYQDLTKYFAYLKQINDDFGKFSEQKENVNVKEDAKHRLLISGGNITVISEAEFKAFKESITKIRNSITK